MALAYSYSGYTKLLSPSWIDGSALSRVLANPLARATVLRTLLLALPTWFLKTATWSALGLELRGRAGDLAGAPEALAALETELSRLEPALLGLVAGPDRPRIGVDHDGTR